MLKRLQASFYEYELFLTSDVNNNGPGEYTEALILLMTLYFTAVLYFWLNHQS